MEWKQDPDAESHYNTPGFMGIVNMMNMLCLIVQYKPCNVEQSCIGISHEVRK